MSKKTPQALSSSISRDMNRHIIAHWVHCFFHGTVLNIDSFVHIFLFLCSLSAFFIQLFSTFLSFFSVLMWKVLVVAWKWGCGRMFGNSPHGYTVHYLLDSKIVKHIEHLHTVIKEIIKQLHKAVILSAFSGYGSW